MLLDSFTYEFPLKGKREMLMFSTEMGGGSLKNTNLTEVIKKQTNDIGNDEMLTFRVHHALCVYKVLHSRISQCHHYAVIFLVHTVHVFL